MDDLISFTDLLVFFFKYSYFVWLDSSERLRDLIINLRPPQFELTLSKNAVEKVKTMFKGLNKPQKTAVLKVLMCKDYVLIKGYPGTGM